MRSVVITGVSTGIGLAATKAVIDAGFHVFGSVRTEADARRLRQSFPLCFTPLVFDVTDGFAIENAAKQVAGAIGGPLLYLPLDMVRKQFEVN